MKNKLIHILFLYQYFILVIALHLFKKDESYKILN